MRQLEGRALNFLQTEPDNCSNMEKVLPFPVLYSMGPPDSVETCKEQKGPDWSVRTIQVIITNKII